MAVGIKFEVRVDVEPVRKAMAALPKRVARGVVRKTLRKHTAELVRIVKPQVPVLRDVKTLGKGSQGRTPGLLQSNIIAQPYKGKGRIAFGVMVAPRPQLGIPTNSKWFYPAHLELGHTFHRTADNKKYQVTRDRRGVPTKKAIKRRLELELQGKVYRKIRPRPFMRNPAKQHGQRMADSMAREISQGIMDAWVKQSVGGEAGG